ncbi:unnamed protein product [Parnassius apollo]|uniref:(apollo) hypothetical protein n=1 Tax=Parnassius apollo TaxID=110799 RepID=A0A8S3XE94_PARAO|nr:unnamed protein product [Parnassius apollo]
MTGTKSLIVFSLLAASCLSQRPPYAGSRPIGYPLLGDRTNSSSNDELGNRPVPIEATITTDRLPIEALGDINLIKQLRKYPLDKQPFWFINWEALEENRRNSQTYSLGTNNYIHPVFKK